MLLTHRMVKTMTKKIIDIGFVGLIVFALASCSSMQSVPYQAPSQVKVFTEEVQLEIYQPPLPQEISMRDIEWYVLTTTPCKPATGVHKNPEYYTTERFAYEEFIKEDGTTARRVQRDAEGNRVELPPLEDEDGRIIEVCGNIDQKIAELEKRIGGDFVMMGISVKGYENMAYNLQEIKRYLNQQKEIILYYREATGANSNDDKEDWLEKNKANQEDQVEDATRDNEAQASELAQPEEKKAGFSLQKLIPGLPSSDG